MLTSIQTLIEMYLCVPQFLGSNLLAYESHKKVLKKSKFVTIYSYIFFAHFTATQGVCLGGLLNCQVHVSVIWLAVNVN